MVWTNLLHIDTVTGATEDQAGFHCLGESFGLLWVSLEYGTLVRGAWCVVHGVWKMIYLDGNLLLVLARKIHKMVVFGSD